MDICVTPKNSNSLSVNYSQRLTASEGTIRKQNNHLNDLKTPSPFIRSRCFSPLARNDLNNSYNDLGLNKSSPFIDNTSTPCNESVMDKTLSIELILKNLGLLKYKSLFGDMNVSNLELL